MAKRTRTPAPVERPDDGPQYPVRSLDEIIGQRRAIETLDRAVESNRIHHAWIFHGPVGIGKFTTAVAFGASLLDPTTAPDLTGRCRPDPESETQRLIRSGSHPDLHIITKELAASSRDPQIRQRKQLSIPKGVIEEFLLEPIARTRHVDAASNASKVFIIDQAEMMNAATQNALLKTMEEPAPGSTIILVTSQEDQLLATIRSRCQRVAFAPLSGDELSAWFESGEHGDALDRSQLDWLVAFAGGSPGLAELAMQHELYEWHEALEPMLRETDRGKYPPHMGSEIIGLIEERVEATLKSNRAASKEAANKAWAGRMFFFIGERARRQLSAEADAHRSRAIDTIDAVAQAEENLRSNVNMKIVFEHLVARLAAK